MVGLHARVEDRHLRAARPLVPSTGRVGVGIVLLLDGAMLADAGVVGVLGDGEPAGLRQPERFWRAPASLDKLLLQVSDPSVFRCFAVLDRARPPKRGSCAPPSRVTQR